jgi:hypothetical protein
MMIDGEMARLEGREGGLTYDVSRTFLFVWRFLRSALLAGEF